MDWTVCQTSAPCRDRHTNAAAMAAPALKISTTNLKMHPSGCGPRRTRTSDLFVISEAL